MKKAIAFMVGAAVLAGLLAGTGCKSRDVKKLALGMGPVPVANPAPACDVDETYVLDGYGCWGYYYDDTYGGATGPFRECGFSGTQKVYEVTITESTYLYGYVNSEYDYVAISLRRSCDPDEEPIECYNDDWYEADVGEEVSAGTYYFVIDTPDGSTEYYYEFCVGAG